jgi:hypothetical protein
MKKKERKGISSEPIGGGNLEQHGEVNGTGGSAWKSDTAA